MTIFTKKRSSLVAGVLGISLMLGACSEAGSTKTEGAVVDKYPEQDIEVYVGHGPGGGTDTFVRTITNLMSEEIGGNFNVINQEGGSGVIAMQNAVREEADGYTLVGDSAYAVTTAAGTNAFGLDKIIPIARIQSDIYSLQVKNGTFKTIDELIEYADKNPGKVRLGAVGTMGIDEITARRFIEASGVDMSYIPMEGAGQMHADLLGDHIEVILEEVGPTISYIEEGEFVPLVFFAEERLEAFEDVPTTVEKGWDLTDGVERYLMIHSDAPQDIIDKLETAAKNAMETEEYQEYAKSTYLNLRNGWMGSEEFTQKLEKDIERYEEILADMK
ncbi:Bug family tripartite tricarboxylate transporter substrate binding protein [Sporosarcina aquimarina]|uniref:Tripartite tricarboxylate transporter substrate binding protein n=1 Tax=Sporosarcina aquimarina TaxID=114975 RepID=A0ABU4G2E9_9BACL|nr:tripartite tricarboxylate transporter substrate binding protein [Sporosarcina aquimarina]MDW0111150.1 tripartite tricarboxylate transporter substrate binding protein [Sporosarcina aquimarina]